MTDSVRELQNHCDLTTRLEAANEEIEIKDRLKDEFINIGAHELRALAPTQYWVKQNFFDVRGWAWLSH